MHGAVIEREDPLHSYLGIIKRTSATRAFAPGEVNLQLYVCIFRHAFMKCKDPPLYWLGFFFFALCCLGKIPGGAPFSQLHKSGNGSRVDRP